MGQSCSNQSTFEDIDHFEDDSVFEPAFWSDSQNNHPQNQKMGQNDYSQNQKMLSQKVASSTSPSPPALLKIGRIEPDLERHFGPGMVLIIP